MNVEEMIEDMGGLEVEERLDLLDAVIVSCKEELEILLAEQKRLFEEVGVGFVTASGRKVLKKTRKSTSIDVEMFRLTDKGRYMQFAEEGKLAVPSACIKELDQDSPYITTSVSEWYALQGDKKQ